MTFEDYNYQSFNPFILVNKDNEYQITSPVQTAYGTLSKVPEKKTVNFEENLPSLTK
jgi:hypothetical protein